MTRSKTDGEVGGVPDLSQLVTSKKYECVYDGCKRSYTSMGNLKTHLKAHQGKYDHKCDHGNCEKAFLSSYSLKVHRRIHTGERPYSCESDGCDKSFNTLYRLNAHKRIHTGHLFDCDFDACSKQFTTRSDMKKHTRTHSGEKPYHCKIDGCGKAFKAPHHLRTHSVKHQSKYMTSKIANEEEAQDITQPHSISSTSSSTDTIPNELDVVTISAYSPTTSQLLESLSQESGNWLSSLVPITEQSLSSSSSTKPSSAIITSQYHSPLMPEPMVSQQNNPLGFTVSTTSSLQPTSTFSFSQSPSPVPLPAQGHLRLTSEITNALQALQVLSHTGALQSLLNLSQLQSVPPPNTPTSLPSSNPPFDNFAAHHNTIPTSATNENVYPNAFSSLPLLPPMTQLGESMIQNPGGSHDYTGESHDFHQLSQSMHTFPPPHPLLNSSEVQSTTSLSKDRTFTMHQSSLMQEYDDYLDHGTQTLPIDLDALLASPYPALNTPAPMLVSSNHDNISGNSHHNHHHPPVPAATQHTIQPNFVATQNSTLSSPVTKVDQASQTDTSISCSTDCCSVVKAEKCACCGCCSCDCCKK